MIDRTAEWVIAKQYLRFALQDLEEAIRFSGSDDKYDMMYRDNHFEKAVMCLNDACDILGIKEQV